MRRFVFLIFLSLVVQSVLGAPLHFLVLSDIHFDPFVSCNQKPCPLIKKLQEHSPSEWSGILSQYETQASHFLQDTNGILLEKSLIAAKKEAEQSQPQFVLVLGDFLGHEFYKRYKKYADDPSHAGYQTFLRNVLTYLTQRLHAIFPLLSIYALVGNNDSYLGDYFTVPESAFFHDAGRLLSGLIQNPAQQTSMRKQFDYAGYYALNFPTDNNARMIMLNSNVFSWKAKGKRADETARRELDWLHQQLLAAKKNNQRVLIAMHIPDGIDAYMTARLRLFRLFTLWKSRYVQQFQDEMQTFAPQIAGIISGHLHRTYYHQRAFGGQEILWVGASAISPIFGKDTGFQVLTYTISPLQIKSYTTRDLRE